MSAATFPRAGAGIVQHITTSLDMGGAQAMLVKLIEAGRGKRTHATPVVLSLMKPEAMMPRLRACDCPVYSLGMKKGWPTPLSLLRMLRITASVRPDLLQGWMYHGNVAASIAGASRRLPVIWNVRHSLADIRREKPGTRMLLSLSARLSGGARAIIYNSRAAAREHEAIGFHPERTIVIPNGFECSRFRPDRSRRRKLCNLFAIDEDATVVGMIARLHPMKDQAMLVRAVGRARRAGHDLHLLLAGPGLDTPPHALAATIAQELPPDRVTLVGERSDVADWLPGFDIVALSSAWGEAFPNILGEAMACGLPCVATDVGDSRWILGESGMIVPPGDVGAMAEALTQLAVAGPEARQRLGETGRARVIEYFAIEQVALQYRRLYENVLGAAVMSDGMKPAPAVGGAGLA